MEGSRSIRTINIWVWTFFFGLVSSLYKRLKRLKIDYGFFFLDYDICVISSSTSSNVLLWFHLMLAGTQESEALLFLSGPLLRSERLLQTTASPSSNIR